MAGAGSPNFLLVSCMLPPEQSKDSMLSILKSRVDRYCDPSFPTVRFDVPDGDQALKFGSFDNLIKLSDDLQKHDSTIEAVLRRMERQTLELIPDVQFKVLSQKQPMTWDAYVRKFQWDDSKYPKTRPILDNLQVILGATSRLDEEVRNKTVALSDVKSSLNQIAKREGANFLTADLIDILTPDTVKAGANEDSDFIFTEHLTTLVCIVNKSGTAQFLKGYEKIHDRVVPMSAKQFTDSSGQPLSDKDGNMLWRVVMFKPAADDFIKKAKDLGAVTRKFDYSSDNYRAVLDSRMQKTMEVEAQEKFLRKICQATFSDTLVGWMHIKAMRVFVESVLRFGVPPRFATFLLKPGKSMPQLRKELNGVLGASSSFGTGYVQKAAAEAEADGEEYYTYPSVGFSPLVLGKN